MIHRRLYIHGRVQGVGYRAWTVATARALGLSGWVRNRRDGAVEALVAGEAADVAVLVARCRQGPPAARVDRIEESDTPPEAMEGFEARPTL